MTVRRRLALLLPLALLTFGSAGAEGPARAPTAAATAWAIKISSPAAAAVTTPRGRLPTERGTCGRGVVLVSRRRLDRLRRLDDRERTTTAVETQRRREVRERRSRRSRSSRASSRADAVDRTRLAGTGLLGRRRERKRQRRREPEGRRAAGRRPACRSWRSATGGSSPSAPQGIRPDRGHRDGGLPTASSPSSTCALTADHGGLPAGERDPDRVCRGGRPDRSAGDRDRRRPRRTTATTPPTTNPSTGDAPRLGRSRGLPEARPAEAAAEADGRPLRLPRLRRLLVHRHVRRDARGRHLPPRRRHLRPARASRCSRSPTGRSSRSAGTRSAATASGSSTRRGTSSTTRTSRRSRRPRRTART